MHILQEMLITFPVLKLDTTSSKIFFLSTIIKWNNLDPTLWNSKSFVVFKKITLKFIRPFPSNVFNCNNYEGIRFITRLHIGMSLLYEHKFKHNFQNCVNLVCSCGLDIEPTSHFLLNSPSFNDVGSTLLNTLNKLDCKLL